MIGGSILGIPVYMIAGILAGIAALQLFANVEIIPMSKKWAGVLLIGGGLIFAGGMGYISMEGFQADDGEAQPQFEFDASLDNESDAVHVTKYDDDTVVVQYKENSSGAINFAGDDSVLDEVEFYIAMKRLDDLAEEDAIASVSANQAQVDNSDADDSPFDLIEERDTGELDAALTPAGGTVSYESTKVLLEPATSKLVTVNLVPNDTALSNLETYDDIETTVSTSGGQITVQFLRVG
jgi:hypothetical protein